MVVSWGKKINWEEFVVQKLGHSVEVCPRTVMQSRPETAEGPIFIQFIPEASCRRPVVIDGILVFVDIDAEAQGPDIETTTMTAADAQSARAEQSAALARRSSLLSTTFQDK